MASIFDETTVLATAKAVPPRTLVVSPDKTLLSQVSSLLTGHDIETNCAEISEEALTLCGCLWIPVAIIDEDIPALDGIELVSRIRALAARPIYIMMLTAHADNAKIEHGYCAGVDLYIPKKEWETILPRRVTESFSTLRLRRTGRYKIRNDSVITVDLQSGAHTARHLVGRLSAEIMLARRQASCISVLSLGIHNPKNARAGQQPVSDEHISAILGALKQVIRAKRDWVAWLHRSGADHRLLIVLPGLEDASAVIQSVRNCFVVQSGEPDSPTPGFSFGSAVLKASDKSTTALELLGKAEGARRSARDGVASAFDAIQRSGEQMA